MTTTAPAPVLPDRYVKALGDRDPIPSLRKAPKRVRKLLEDRSEKELAWKPAPDKWSIKEVLAHFADGEVILGARLRFVAAMDNAPLPGYDQDQFVARLGIEKVKGKALLEAWESMRALNVGLLERLPEEAFARTGMHAERGPESIEKMVSMYAGHDLLHEAQLERLLSEQEAERAAKKQEKAARKAEKKAAKQARKALLRAQKAEKRSSNAKVTKKKDEGEPKPARKPEKKLEALLGTR